MEREDMVKSKYYRLRMSEELAGLIRALPWRVEREVRSRECVYLGRGRLRLHGREHEVDLAVRMAADGTLEAEARSATAPLSVRGPFNSRADTSAFAGSVRRAVRELETGPEVKKHAV